MSLWVQLAVLAGTATAAFGAGWNWNGALWQAKYTQLETEIALRSQAAEEAVRLTVSKAYQDRLAEAERLRTRSDEQTATQALAIQYMQKQLTKVRSSYQSALTNPACEVWAAQLIGCEFDEVEP
jgi:hypothetical protein